MSAILKSSEVAIPQLPMGWQVVTTAILADGKLALLAADADLEHEWRRDSNGSVLGKPFDVAARAVAQLWCFDGLSLKGGPSFPLEAPISQIDRFEDGRWLVVESRTRGDTNARVISPDGQLLARFMLGDGIIHMGVDHNDKIWVGWFDEGIYGNDEWRVPNEEWPPSSRGIGLFSEEGDYQKLSAFPDSTDISDCYALNVAEDGTWACPYGDFPILRLQQGHPIRWWSNEVAGASAMAVSQGYVLLAGGYGAYANRVALIALTGEGKGEVARPVATWHLPLGPRLGEPPEIADSHPWQYPALLAGRDDTIHMVLDGAWHRWRVSDSLLAINSVAKQ